MTVVARSFAVETKIVESILSSKCVVCHKDNPRVPFDFHKASDFNANKKIIAEVVRSGYMPLWKADVHYSHFDNEVFLTEEEKKTILEWCESDVKIQKINSNKQVAYRYKKPDFSVLLKDSFIVPATGEDVFATIKIPFEFSSEQYVRGIEFVNLFPFLIHHASIFIVREAENMDIQKGIDRYLFKEDNSIPKKDFNLLHEMNLIPYNKQYLWDYLVYKTHWQFGMSSYVLPDSCGFILPKKGAIVLSNIHYKGTMKEVKDVLSFNFIKQSVESPRQCISTSIGNGQLSYVEPPLLIEPNKIQVHYSSIVLPADMSLMEVTPHMHYVGRQFVSYAITPKNDTIPIIRIKDWDADWQETYRFNPMLKIPKGSVLYIRGVYDNTRNNPKNPNNPPKKVGESMNKHDEMLEMLISFFPYLPNDEKNKIRYVP